MEHMMFRLDWARNHNYYILNKKSKDKFYKLTFHLNDYTYHQDMTYSYLHYEMAGMFHYHTSYILDNLNYNSNQASIRLKKQN